MKLFLETSGGRDAWEYGGETMTVQKLIRYLSQYENDVPVYLINSRDFTCDTITESRFKRKYEDDELYEVYFDTGNGLKALFTGNLTETMDFINNNRSFHVYKTDENGRFSQDVTKVFNTKTKI